MMKLCMHFEHSKDRLLKVFKLFRCPKSEGFGDLSFSNSRFDILKMHLKFHPNLQHRHCLINFFLKTRYPLGFDTSLAPNLHIEMPYHFSLVVILQNRLKQALLHQLNRSHSAHETLMHFYVP